jgi:DNA-binding HxlR family transcriptional regulator
VRWAPEGIATNMLADRLRRLEQEGLIRKEQDQRDSRQHVYKPTRLAVSVVPMLIEMTVWGARSSKHTTANTIATTKRMRRLN